MHCFISSDPLIQELENKVYKLEVRLIVFYVFTALLVLVIILMFRIARTYKLSLISAESKLQALLIHSSHYLSPNRVQTDSSLNTHQSEPIINAHTPNSEEERQCEMTRIPPLKMPSPIQKGSIWRKIGDYIIHVKENGDVKSYGIHNINNKEEDNGEFDDAQKQQQKNQKNSKNDGRRATLLDGDDDDFNNSIEDIHI